MIALTDEQKKSLTSFFASRGSDVRFRNLDREVAHAKVNVDSDDPDSREFAHGILAAVGIAPGFPHHGDDAARLGLLGR